MNSLLVFDAAFFVTFFTFNSGYLDDTPPEISPQEPYEYCSGEEFRARCNGPDEVVVISDATYGRAAAGRCFSEAEQQMGCIANFTEHLEALCSGRRSCTLRVPNPEMDRVNKCPQSLKASLYASYRCVKVAESSCRSCHTAGHAKVTGDRGYLASIVTMETQNDEGGCGSSRCPWLIQVPAGQGINLTLIDFTAGHQQQPQPTSPQHQRPGVPSSDRCSRLLVVKERANPKDSQVCGGRAKWKHIHLSVSHFVEVHVVGQDVFSGKGQFLVYYEAVGCPDITPPKDSRMKRMHDRCEIDCPGTPHKWSLTCVDNKWVGDDVGKCPASSLEVKGTAKPTSSGVWPLLTSLPLNVLITLVVAVTVIIGVVIITTGIVCLKKNRYKSRHRPDSAIYTGACSEFEFRQDLMGANTALVPKPPIAPGTALLVAPSSKPRRPSADLLMPVRDNTYAVDRGMESRPLPAIPDATPHSSIQRDHLNRVMVQIHPSMETVSSNQARPTIVCRGGVGPGRDERRALPPGSPAHRGQAVSAGAGPAASGGALQGDNHHYFILDPDVLVEEPATPCPEHSLGYRSTECQTQPVAMPYRKSPAGQGETGQGRAGLPAGQGSGGANGIQLRPIREGSNPQKKANPQSSGSSNSGIGSWP